MCRLGVDLEEEGGVMGSGSWGLGPRGARAFVFFFSSRRRHTRFDCDWSSDVCSSDLIGRAPEIRHASVESPGTIYLFDLIAVEGFDLRSLPLVKRKALLRKVLPEEIGRASCRERV